MIPTITTYLYQLHHNKLELETQLERKRAIRMLTVITILVSLSALLWTLYK